MNKPTLEQLCQPLNVDPVYDESMFNELQLTLDEQSENLETLKSDLHDYKTKCEELEEKISDFEEWIKELDTSNSIDEIVCEFKKVFI